MQQKGGRDGVDKTAAKIARNRTSKKDGAGD